MTVGSSTEGANGLMPRWGSHLWFSIDDRKNIYFFEAFIYLAISENFSLSCSSVGTVSGMAMRPLKVINKSVFFN